MANWNGKKVFVTGAGGFIGSHLCEALVDLGAEVTAMIRYSSRSDWGNLEFLPSETKGALRIVAGNVEDSDFLARNMAGHECVFHLAALIGIPYSYASPKSYVRTNVEGTLNVLETCRKNEVERIVHTSTSEAYGTARYVPIDEDHPMQGQSPYAASKIGADKVAESYFLSFNLPVVTVRPFNSFGPRQSARAVIPTIISQALAQPEIKLGALDPVRDLNYVADTVSGFIAAAESESAIGKAINIGRGEGITIGELARKILDLMECEKEIVEEKERLRPPNSEVMQLVCNADLAREILGWQPKYSFDEGLTETIVFVSEHPGFYKPDRYAC